jgi:hypothetical protein
MIAFSKQTPDVIETKPLGPIVVRFLNLSKNLLNRAARLLNRARQPLNPDVPALQLSHISD